MLKSGPYLDCKKSGGPLDGSKETGKYCHLEVI